MTSASVEFLINHVLIGLSRSFLQYVAESRPWVDETARKIEEQVKVLAARQRQDVAELADLLIDREWAVDFGSFPTEYTNLHFISLSTLFDWLNHGQSVIADSLTEAVTVLRESGDAAAVDRIEAIRHRQNDLAGALKELQQELNRSAASA